MNNNEIINRQIEEKSIKISDILLMQNNPRYTFLEEELIDFGKISNNVDNQTNAFENLIKSEGNLEKTLNLIESFADKGFSIREDVPPYTLKKSKTDNYVVIEGNRRILCLKLLARDPLFLKLLREYESNENMINYFDTETIEHIKTNLKKIKDLIDTYEGEINLDYEIKVYNVLIKDLEDNELKILSDEITELIASRHSYSESSLKKEWSRIKMFYELRLRFQNRYNLNLNEVGNSAKALEFTYNYLKKIYKRTLSTIKGDVKTAYYVTNILNYYIENKNISIENIDYRINSSSIELSLSKVINIKTKLSLRKELQIEYINLEGIVLDRNISITEITNKKYNWEKLSDFVIQACISKSLNTRDFDICRNNGDKDQLTIEKYSKLFDLSKSFVEENLICKKYSDKLEENIIQLSKSSNEFVQILEKEGINLEPSKEYKKNFNKLLTKSSTIFEKLDNEIIEKSENTISIFSSLILMDKSQSGKLQVIKKELEELDIDKNEFYKKSLHNTLIRILNFEMLTLENSLNDGSALDNDGALYYLSIIIRSLIEMLFVYSGHFLNDIYSENERRHNANYNPLTNYKYKYGTSFPDILVFNNNKPSHKVSSTIRSIKKLYDKHGYIIPPFDEETSESLYKAYIFCAGNNWKLINKMIHRTWSVSNRKYEESKFNSSFVDLKKFIDESWELILSILEQCYKWIIS